MRSLPGGVTEPRTTSSVGRAVRSGQSLALQPGEQRPRGLLALAAVWLADRGQAKIGGQPTGVVEADDREVGRDPQTRVGGRLDRALGKPVAQAEQGGRAGLVVQQGGRPGCSVSGGAVRPGPDRDAVPVNAVPGGRRAIAGEPVATDGVRRCLLGGHVGKAGPAGVTQTERDDPDPAMPEAQHVVRRRFGSGVVVDPHPRDRGITQSGELGRPGLIDDDHRQPAEERQPEQWVVVGHRGDDDTVHDRAGDRGVPAPRIGGAGQQQQSGAGLLDRGRHPGQEGTAGRVVERVGELVVVRNADRADPAPAQPGGDRVRTGVPQARGGREHPLAQFGGQLVRTHVRVGHGLGRDPELRCDIAQGQPTGWRRGHTRLSHFIVEVM